MDAESLVPLVCSGHQKLKSHTFPGGMPHGKGCFTCYYSDFDLS